MPSPFPGMNPYLEEPSLWAGAHQRLIVGMRIWVDQQLKLQGLR